MTRTRRCLRWTVGAALVLASAGAFALAILRVCLALAPLPTDVLAVGARPLTVVDRHGEPFAELPVPGATVDAWTRLEDVPAIAVAAVIESEDQRFWEHGGLDALGLTRAAWLNLRAGRLAFGGSTLTQQLARLLLGPTRARTLSAKADEALLALRLEAALSKREILEQWLARAYFGAGAYGYRAAAATYFGRPPAALSTGEAVLLAVLPRSPNGYELHGNLARALARRDHVLGLLVQRGVLSDDDAAAARAQPIALAPAPAPGPAPHFARWVDEQLPPDVRARGGVVRTTLDLAWQRRIAARAEAHVATLADANVQQASVVVLEPGSGNVRVMVGAADPDGPGHAINLALRRRHPGSALKPFVYALAFEDGAHPHTIGWDVREAQPEYHAPHAAEHGPVSLREALGSSYNFAAVDVLAQVGVGRLMSRLRAGGIATAEGDAEDYGLRLALGSAKVRLLDLAAGYGFLVEEGRVTPPRAILEVIAADGRRWSPMTAPPIDLVEPAAAWLTLDVLADPAARRPGFGDELPFDLPFAVAAKTGTARGFADTWAVAATREVIAAAWAGTVDGTSGHGVVGMQGAAPLVRDALLAVATQQRLTLPPRPDDVEVIDVCPVSGMAPGPDCPHVREVARATDEHDPTTCTWHHRNDRGALVVRYPERAAQWAARQRAH